MAEYSVPANTPLNDDTVRALRADFPILNTVVNGNPLVYLDSGATSQKPLQVLDAERNFYLHANSAVHRGAHTLAVEATELFEQARTTVAAFVRFALQPGDEILTTEIEHHANLIPWQILAQRTGATLKHIPATGDGQIDYEAAAELVTEKTRILAFTHVSNVTGAIADVPRFVSLAQKVGALTVLDACQSVPHMPVDFPTLGVDFAAFSGHKMLAPTGIGALYGRAELLDALPPFLTGGSMITRVELQDADYMPAPIKFEAGTQRVSQAVAFAEAVRYLQHLGMDNVHAWEQELGARLVAGVQNIEGVRLLGPTDPNKRAGLVSLGIDGVHPHDAGQLLDTKGIAVRVGHHCAQPLHRGAGLTASTRASAYLYNTTEDIDAFLAALAEVRPYFGL